MDDLVQIAVYLNDVEAEIAKASLVSGGMEVRMFVENIGGEGPRQGRLLVNPGDVNEACELLGLELPAVERPLVADKTVIAVGLVLVGLALAGWVVVLVQGF